MAKSAWRVTCSTRDWIVVESRDGVTYMVSGKYGPSSGSTLSKMANMWNTPRSTMPSTATSPPGM